MLSKEYGNGPTTTPSSGVGEQEAPLLARCTRTGNWRSLTISSIKIVRRWNCLRLDNGQTALGTHHSMMPFAQKLGWPLHAIGDATVPHHVVATLGHGHVPYETWVDRPESLDFLLKRSCPFATPSCNSTTLQNAQVAQASRVLQIAFKWRTFLDSNGVRNFITALAEQTLAMTGGDDVEAWPYCDVCSALQFVDDDLLLGMAFRLVKSEVIFSEALNNLIDEEFADDPTIYYDMYKEEIGQLVEQAMGAKIAFLVWASESMLDQCIANNSYGCVDGEDCCGFDAYVCGETNFCHIVVP